MSTTTDTQPAATEQWSGTNLAGDIVEIGIKKHKPEFQGDLRWWFRYSLEKKMSQAECAAELGVDGSTYSRVMRGEYKNENNGYLPPPAKMLSRIRVLRNQLRIVTEEQRKSRVVTLTTKEIHQVCRKAWDDKQIAFIFGNSHVGKTENLLWFRDENNHGATIYVDLQAVSGVQDIYREFARALGLGADGAINKLMPRVHNAIDKSNLVIVDEFHSITHAYQKGSAIRMINALKSIKDRTGCAMVICSTDVGRDEIEKGKDAKLLQQLNRRGVIKLHLPSALRVADVRAVVRASKLDFPDAPKGTRKDLWKHLREDNPNFVGLDLCERIAYNHGIKHLFSVIADGKKMADRAERALEWDDVLEAQAIYDALSNPKKEV
ncbi:MAG: ATP-binding protein [Candidatus Didemnitutus sp.]|nr:ATP-binding protein [Candidatus Didemnitutus sp.]